MDKEDWDKARENFATQQKNKILPLPNSNVEQEKNSFSQDTLEREAILEKAFMEMYLSYNRQFQPGLIRKKAQLATHILKSTPTKHLMNLVKWAASNIKNCPSDYDLVEAWKANSGVIKNWGRKEDSLSVNGYYDTQGAWIPEGTYYTFATLPLVDMTDEQLAVTCRKLEGKLNDEDQEKLRLWSTQKFYPRQKNT